MKPDSYLESLLRKWGREWFSEDLGYPHRCSACRDYRPKGYKELGHDIDRPEVERLAEWLPINLSNMRIHVLRARYRKRMRNKQKAAAWMKKNGFPSMSERKYREQFNSAIRTIQKRF